MLGQEKEADQEVDRKGAHKTKRVIVVLEQASLETIKTKKGYELACADTHAGMLKKLRKDATPAEFRPDILHRVLFLRACFSNQTNDMLRSAFWP